MKIYKKNGFTFIELLAVITILGILTTVVVVSYSKYLDNARERYYKSQEDSITLAGKEYFTDFRSKLPTVVGSKAGVDLETLYSKKYIDRMKDYNGKVCDAAVSDINNKVYAYKVADGVYLYYTIVECNGYVTNEDSKKPVIVFSPNQIKGTNSSSTNIKMTITDNAKVEYYSYEVIKDGEIIKEEEVKPYQNPVTITLKEEGTYQIRGHAIDSSGNKTDKTSGKYVIDRTPPDCSLIKIESTNGSKKEKWQNKKVKLKITPHSDIDNWKFSNCFMKANSSTAYYCKTDGTNLIGPREKSLNGVKSPVFGNTSYKDNGHVYGRVTAYDTAGNYCIVKTDTYYVDTDPPVIKTKTITSTTSNYNSLKVNITLSITDRVDRSGNKIYYSITTSSTATPSWKIYRPSNGKVTISYTFSGKYDGKQRTLYIRAKDELNNISKVSKAYYKVYKECTSTELITSTGSCSASLGVGTLLTTNTKKDSYTGVTCSTTTTSTSCCNGPKVTESDWGACSESCGGGTQTKTITTETCDGKTTTETKTQSCNTACCTTPRTDVISDWGACSTSCGGGVQYRTLRTYECDGSYSDRQESQQCNTQSCCSGASVSYSDWGACSTSCGGGVQYRTKTSVNCDGSVTTETESQACNTQGCCTEPDVKTYGEWSACSKPCKGGTKSRTKTVTKCDGTVINSVQTKECNTTACPEILQKSLTVCPEDQLKPTREQCLNGNLKFNTLKITKVEKDGYNIIVEGHLVNNETEATYISREPERTICIANKKNECKVVLEKFDVSNTSYAPLGAQFKKFNSKINTLNLKKGKYRVIVKNTSGESPKWRFQTTYSQTTELREKYNQGWLFEVK